jgi:isopentenyl phosphate kinase
LVYGDVALDDVRGGTIVSTEEIFGHLAGAFNPARILLAGEAQGVYGEGGEVVPRITPNNVAQVGGSLAGSKGVDVTGGMLSKVAHMLDLVRAQPGLVVHIFSGVEPGLLTRVLLEPELPVGTRILAGS